MSGFISCCLKRKLLHISYTYCVNLESWCSIAILQHLGIKSMCIYTCRQLWSVNIICSTEAVAAALTAYAILTSLIRGGNHKEAVHCLLHLCFVTPCTIPPADTHTSYVVLFYYIYSLAPWLYQRQLNDKINVIANKWRLAGIQGKTKLHI